MKSTFRISISGLGLLLTALACTSPMKRAPANVGAAYERSLTSVEIDIASAVLREVGSQQQAGTVACLTLLGPAPGRFTPTDAFVRRVAGSRQLVPSSECPRTYTSMTVRVDSLGRSMDPPRPPGYVDPYHIYLGRPQFDGADQAYILVREEQGTRGREFSCESGGVGPRGRVVRCTVVRQWIS